MIFIDYKDARPIYEQIKDGLRKLIVTGAMKPDEKLPSVRSMAQQLSINPNTIQRAYMELERQGFIYSVKGRGNFVVYDERLLNVRRQEVFVKLQKLVREAEEIGMTTGELKEWLDNYSDKASGTQAAGGHEND